MAQRKFRAAEFQFTGPAGQTMPRKVSGPKKNGQMYVTIVGKQHQLGSWKFPDLVRENYWRLIADKLAGDDSPVVLAAGLTVYELAESYVEWSASAYVKRGEPTSTLKVIRAALKRFLPQFGYQPANEVRQFAFAQYCGYLLKQVEAGDLVGNVANKYRKITIAMFTWGANRGLVSPNVWQEMDAAPTIGRRDRVKMHGIVDGVPEGIVRDTLKHLPRHFASQIELMAWSAARPQEARCLRTRDVHEDDPLLSVAVRTQLQRLDTPIWVYRVAPEYNKTEHHDDRGPRVILLPPEAQKAVEPWLDIEQQEHYAFSPLHTRPQHENTLRTAIKRVCKKHDIPRWAPNQLRHRAATRLAQAYGIEMTRVLLGHANVATTRIYVDKDVVPREDYDSVALALAGVVPNQSLQG